MPRIRNSASEQAKYYSGQPVISNQPHSSLNQVKTRQATTPKHSASSSGSMRNTPQNQFGPLTLQPRRVNAASSKTPSRQSRLEGFLIHNFRTATSEEIRTQGQVTMIKPGLWTGHMVNHDNNTVIFLGREELNHARAENWMDFHEMNSNSERTVKYSLADEFNYYPDFNDDMEYDAESFYSTFKQPEVINVLLNQAQKHGMTPEKLVDRLDQTETGFCEFKPDTSTRRRKYFVLYTSTKPVEDFAFSGLDPNTPNYAQEILKLESNSKHAQHISMVVGGDCKDNVMEQRGIFKTMTAIVNHHQSTLSLGNDRRRFKMSTALHLFGLQAAIKYNHIHTFFLSPTELVANLIQRDLPSEVRSGHVLVGMDTIKSQNKDNLLRIADKDAVEDGFEIPILFNVKLANPIWR